MTLPARTPVEVEARGLRRRFRHSTRYGPMYFLEIEVEKELWDAAEGIPDAALIGGHLWWHDGDPVGDEKATAPATEPDDAFTFGVKDEPAPPLPKGEPVVREPGPWGSLWRELYAHGFMNNAPLIKFLKVNGMGDSVKIALKKRLDVETLTDCSPDHVEAWLVSKIREGANLQGALEIAERVVEKLGGTAYKWPKKDRSTAA